jgi:hypothetical protein
MARRRGTGRGRNISGLRNQPRTSSASHQQPTACDASVLPDDSDAECTRLASDLGDMSDGKPALEDEHANMTKQEDIEDEKLKMRLGAMEAQSNAQDKDWLLPKAAWKKRQRDETGKQGIPFMLKC